MRSTPGAASVAALLLLAFVPTTAGIASADPGTEPSPSTPVTVPAAAPNPEDMHNVTYRARIDGVSRGALITYKINDTQVQSADPTMLPGRMFEAQAVLSDAAMAGMQVSIQWPYSANLHCEILVDDITVAQADQFIRPRLTPADDDPDYGKLLCGAPLVSAAGPGNVVNTDPAQTPPPTEQPVDTAITTAVG